MRALVTGAAGFIGSHLAERLAADGWEVVAVDALTPYYEARTKQHNVDALRARGIPVLTADLRTAPLEPLLEGTDVVFHLAAQPGVRSSWDDFATYVAHNVVATQRLLAACAGLPLSRFVFASSSSVYGQVSGTVDEQAPTRPYSPYGVTKLSAEALCGAYADNYDVPAVSLRLFTVYGPRQRPDMAFHRLVRAALTGEDFPVFGDGSAVRAFTFVDDVVEAAVLAARADVPQGCVLNISGGSTCTVAEAIATVEGIVGRSVSVRTLPSQPGDVRRTDGAVDRAARLLGWHPHVPLAEGLRRQVLHMDADLGVPSGTSSLTRG